VRKGAIAACFSVGFLLVVGAFLVAAWSNPYGNDGHSVLTCGSAFFADAFSELGTYEHDPGRGNSSEVPSSSLPTRSARYVRLWCCGCE
jgi:hypothetical protein